MELNCLIVDDEPLALDLMESYVKRTPFLKLVARCSNALEVLQVLREEAVDLIFLDIQMPELNGLELSRVLDKQIKVILDYLLKPVSYPEFLKAANKALNWFEKTRETQGDSLEEDCIFVKSDYKLVKVELAKICYIEGLKDYVKIYLEGVTSPIVSLISMKSLEEMLPASFCRVHRSFIVNLNRITVIERNRIVFGKTYIPIADSSKDKFMEFLNKRTIK